MNPTKVAICVLVVAILSSAQLARGQGNTVYSCVGPAPDLDGVLSQGEWDEACPYELPLQGPYMQGTRQLPDNSNQSIWVDYGTLNPSLKKSMTLYVMRDDVNVYLGYRWTHEPGSETIDPNRYVLLSAFDFNANGKFEDNDAVVNTIDDALALGYLAFDIRIYLELCPFGKCSVWLDIFIPKGLYVWSWNSTEGAQVIAGPPKGIEWTGPHTTTWQGIAGPGALAPDEPHEQIDFNELYGASVPILSPPLTYGYTIEFAVPLKLFHSPAGFGFFLGQSTFYEDSETGFVWTWPGDLSTVTTDIPTNPELASLLGLIADNVGAAAKGLLDPDSEGPVGGVIKPVDRVVLVLPWLAPLAIVGTITAAWTARKRKRKT